MATTILSINSKFNVDSSGTGYFAGGIQSSGDIYMRGVLVATGSVVRPSDTGFLTGQFYPFTTNPSGYITSGQTGALRLAITQLSTSSGYASTGLFDTAQWYRVARASTSPTSHYHAIFSLADANRAIWTFLISHTTTTGGSISLLNYTNPVNYIAGVTGSCSGIRLTRDTGAGGFNYVEIAHPGTFGESAGRVVSIINLNTSQLAPSNLLTPIELSGVTGSQPNLVVHATLDLNNRTLLGLSDNTLGDGIFKVDASGVWYRGNLLALSGGYYSSSNPSGYITTGQTGAFLTTGQTGAFITTGQTGAMIYGARWIQMASSSGAGNTGNYNLAFPWYRIARTVSGKYHFCSLLTIGFNNEADSFLVSHGSTSGAAITYINSSNPLSHPTSFGKRLISGIRMTRDTGVGQEASYIEIAHPSGFTAVGIRVNSFNFDAHGYSNSTLSTLSPIELSGVTGLATENTVIDTLLSLTGKCLFGLSNNIGGTDVFKINDDGVYFKGVLLSTGTGVSQNGGSSSIIVTGATLTGTITITGVGAVSITSSGQTIYVSGLTGASMAARLDSKILSSGTIDTQFIQFPSNFPQPPIVIGSMVNNSGDSIFAFSLSGISTSGFYVNTTETIRTANYKFNYIATTGSGLLNIGSSASSLRELLSTESYLGITVDNGTQPVATGAKSYQHVGHNMTLMGWRVVTNLSGNLTVDVQKCDYDSYPNFISIASGIMPFVSGDIKNKSVDLSGWNVTINNGDFIRFVVLNSSVNSFNLAITGIKYV
jgi:hypothetical protein